MYDPTKPYKHQILRQIESTWKTPYVTVERGLYPVITKKFSKPEVHHTDGIGTKGFYHWKARTFKAAVRDALAMNLNDLAMVGAVPYALQNHIVLPKDDHAAIAKIISSLVEECKQRHIAMTGGETSIHSDALSMDLSITVAGFLPSRRVNRCAVGDVLIGLRSSGIHSNGLTKVREIYKKRAPKDVTTPTAIYLDRVQSVLRKHKVNGMMHITGGAFSKLKDVLPMADAVITHPRKLVPQRIFQELFDGGLLNKTMYTTFNCGIGFVLSVPPREAKGVLALTGGAVIGQVVKGKGRVYVTSAFDGKQIVL